MRVIVKESEEGVLELWEFSFVRHSFVPGELIVQEMNAFRLEKRSNFRVLVDDITKMHFINFWIYTLVTNTGPEQHPWQNSKSLETKCEIPELVEEHGDRRQDIDLEGILEALALVIVIFKGGESAVEEVLIVRV